ncbi:MAG: metallophosphoesterase [Bacteroidetes bacterium]|nr:metallophosphoesterase [Bacteroidota bacterium]
MNNSVLFIITIVFLLAGCRTPKAPEASEKDGFTFAFLTDIHLQPELNAVAGFQKAIDTINIIKPDFVLTGGDLVMDVLNQSYGRADSVYKLYKKVSGGLNMPVYNTVGNHEMYGWHRDEEGIEEHPEFGKKMFESRMGDRFYSFDHKGWHFIVLDAIYRGDDGHYIGRIDQEQIDWLKKDLEKVDKKTPLAMSAHIPFITSSTQLGSGSMTANPEGLVINNSLEVLRLFLDHNLRLVLQGHLHFIEDIFVQNQVHFITGGAVCGRWWNSKPESLPQEGFMLLHLKGEEVDWEYVDYGWTP